MASLQQLKNRLAGIPDEPKKSTPKSKLPLPTSETVSDSSTSSSLEIEEARYLLSLIARTEFSGKDIQIVYNTALKLQEILQSSLNKENNG